jgi:hypothetical protein
MTELVQEIMTAVEAAEWFRRSVSWLRQQPDLLRISGRRGQPLFHVRVCRAYILGRLRGVKGEALREVQLDALAAACEVAGDDERTPVIQAGQAPATALHRAEVRPPAPTLPAGPARARKSPAR